MYICIYFIVQSGNGTTCLENNKDQLNQWDEMLGVTNVIYNRIQQSLSNQY